MKVNFNGVLSYLKGIYKVKWLMKENYIGENVILKVNV